MLKTIDKMIYEMYNVYIEPVQLANNGKMWYIFTLSWFGVAEITPSFIATGKSHNPIFTFIILNPRETFPKNPFSVFIDVRRIFCYNELGCDMNLNIEK